MSRFTDQKPRIVSEEELEAPWGGDKPGERFRCWLCGHKFELGEYWRWVFGGNHEPPLANFMVCMKCDDENVIDHFAAATEEAKERFWWLYG